LPLLIWLETASGSFWTQVEPFMVTRQPVLSTGPLPQFKSRRLDLNLERHVAISCSKPFSL
jgi:hypothetical protein